MSEQYPFSTEKYLLIGKITKAHGLKGELKVLPFADVHDKFSSYSRLALVAEDGRMTTMLNLAKARIQGRHVILKLDSIETKSEADLTAGMGVLIAREDLPESDTDDFYLQELGGVTVWLHGSNKLLGTIENCFSNGAQNIAVVRMEEDEYYIPLINEIIVSQDNQQMIIDPPPGLLEINRGKD